MSIPSSVTILGYNYQIVQTKLVRTGVVAVTNYSHRLIEVDDSVDDSVVYEHLLYEILTIISRTLLGNEQLTDRQTRAVATGIGNAVWTTDDEDTAPDGLGFLSHGRVGSLPTLDPILE